MPIRVRIAAVACLLLAAGCQPPTDNIIAPSQVTGQALRVAFGLSQAARQVAEAAASAPAPGCRPRLACPFGPALVETSLKLQKQQPKDALQQTENRSWSRDASGNLRLSVEFLHPTIEGGADAQTLTLLRIGADRFGARNGRFVRATYAPLLDARIEADPQAEFDQIVAAAMATGSSGEPCGEASAQLPGRVSNARFSTSETGRNLSFELELDASPTLKVEMAEKVACSAPTIARPVTVEAEPTLSDFAAIESFLTRGFTEGWLIAPQKRGVPATR